MRKLSLIFVILLSATSLFAQNPNRVVKHFEVELNVGTLNSFASGAVELRYNFPQHWDIGARACIDGIAVAGGCGNSFNIISDYSFAQEKRVSPFVGIGTGLYISIPGDYVPKIDNSYYFHLMPRFGIEICDRLRITGYLNIIPSYNNFADAGISLGFVFGGGKENKIKYKNR